MLLPSMALSAAEVAMHCKATAGQYVNISMSDSKVNQDAAPIANIAR